MTLNANQIIDLLAARHSKDVFVPQCKDGPTQGVRHFDQMDAWVMPRSWSNPATTAYEVKVSRNDFIGDNKWPKYLAYCNYFYFVCPWKLISVQEVPAQCGLCWVSQTGTKVFVKVKAPYREVVVPESLFRYILMCRAEIQPSGTIETQVAKDYWKRWLVDQKRDHEFGWQVSKSIKKLIERDIEKVVSENRALRSANEEYAEIKKTIQQLGLSTDLSAWDIKRTFQHKLEEYQEGCPAGFVENLNGALANLQRLRGIIVKQQEEE